jgi:hypothetical protein
MFALAICLPLATQAGLDHEGLAKDWLAAHDSAAHGSNGDHVATLEQLVTGELAYLDLGAFEVRFDPRLAAEPARAAEVLEASIALLDAQAEWIDWLCAAQAERAAEREAARRDLLELRAALAALRPKDLARHRLASGAAVLDRIGLSDEQRLAAARLCDLLRSGAPLVHPAGTARATRLVLMPSRADFVAFASVLALLEPDQRPYYWVDDLALWTELDHAGSRVLAFEFATPDALRDFPRGTSMRERNPRALAEQVVQVAVRSLLDTQFGERMDPILAGGIANELVIEVFGEVDTRSDGDLRSRSVSGRSAFVPGGDPNGGTLPPLDANSRWRAGKGKDHFVHVLRAAQKQGSKEARKAHDEAAEDAAFLLLDDAQAGSWLARAPFFDAGFDAGNAGLGASCRDRTPPTAFAGDWAEFARAYRTCFLYWLRAKGTGTGDSAATYARFLRRLAESQDAAEFTALVEEVFGLPLSSEALGRDCLEGRFLAWLAKQR